MDQLQKMISHIYAEMEKTPYRCAIGIIEYRRGESIESPLARADEDMDRNKKDMKVNETSKNIEQFRRTE